jgi:hypothetical protein
MMVKLASSGGARQRPLPWWTGRYSVNGRAYPNGGRTRDRKSLISWGIRGKIPYLTEQGNKSDEQGDKIDRSGN